MCADKVFTLGRWHELGMPLPRDRHRREGESWTMRRRELLIGAGVIAASGAGPAAARARDRSAYAAAVSETWRHAGSTELAFGPTRLELIRYATRAANNHNAQPWIFGTPGRAILIRPDPARPLPAHGSLRLPQAGRRNRHGWGPDLCRYQR